MKHIFKVTNQWEVPDGTLVAPFMNPFDSNSSTPLENLRDISIAEGNIGSFVQSKIQIMPYVNQITYVLEGTVKIIMKGPNDKGPYVLEICRNESIIAYKNEFLQLINETNENCKVLYIVSPAYVCEIENGDTVYDDAIVIDKSWNDLEIAKWKIENEVFKITEREEAIKRICNRKK
jgi:hypothetical protein